MEQPTSISIIIPAFNEIQRIERSIAEVKEFFEGRGQTYEIIVVADGDDGTRELVGRMAELDSRR